MSETLYTVEIPDLEYWKRQIKCQAACPVRTDARGYIQAIRQGDPSEGYLIARAPNPLSSICGRICGAPCEAACRRGNIDRPIAIRALKRFVTERHGAENHRGSALGFFNSLVKRGDGLECADAESLPAFRGLTEARPLTEKKIAIVGSGPAGLAASHDLALMGGQVTLYEMENEPGGMLALGIPEYRLRREIIQAEVEVIRSLGVRMVTNTCLGRDIQLETLRKDFDAVVIAVGAKRSRKIPIPGMEASGVLGGVDFLREVALGRPVSLGQRVVVIGGGNVAYDVARTVLRQIESDISRVALRQPFVKEVHLCCLESLDEMPADDIEILEGEEEGIYRHNSLGPSKILVSDGKASGVVFKRCLSVFDEQKRFAPVFDDSALVTLDADTIIMSVGQEMDLSFLDGVTDVQRTDRGHVKLSPELMSTAPGVFFAGDVAHGARLVIDAEASGKKAARAVFEYLTGRTLRLESTSRHRELPGWSRERDYEKLPRTAVPTAMLESRVHSVSADVELGFDEALAVRESDRCLDCGVNTIFNGDKCILCGGCADVCPERCLKLVSVTALQGKNLQGALAEHFEDHPVEDASAIIKDEDMCIRCGLCAERCPTDAITMERFTYRDLWHVT